jgi:NAD(P)-dependent dehydrogenase (short-subunit alcohol dehydrogenase family)
MSAVSPIFAEAADPAPVDLDLLPAGDELAGRVVLITPAARGIGRATAAAFARQRVHRAGVTLLVRFVPRRGGAGWRASYAFDMRRDRIRAARLDYA